MYLDRNNNPITVNDVLYFKEIGFFKLKIKDGFAVLHSIDRKYPDLFLDRIIVNTKIKNAIKI